MHRVLLLTYHGITPHKVHLWGLKWMRHLRDGASSASMPVKQPEAVQDEESGTLLVLQGTYTFTFTFQICQHLDNSKRLLSSTWEALAPFSLGDRILLVKQSIRNSSWWSGAWWANKPGQVEWGSALQSSLTTFKYSTFVFGLYTVWDLRTRGYITNREARWAALTYTLGFGLVGAGADYTGLWYWRECVLHRTSHHSSPKPQVAV